MIKKPVVILVERRSSDVLAFIEGNRSLWDCGKSAAEAIGNLVITHPEHFAIEPAIYSPMIEDRIAQARATMEDTRADDGFGSLAAALGRLDELLEERRRLWVDPIDTAPQL